MVRVDTQLTPYRLDLNSRRPVELMVEIVNDSDRRQIVSYDIVLANTLGFDKQGLKNSITRKFDGMQPNEKSREYFEIWPKATARNGNHPILITVTEHYNSYKYILGKKKKRLELKVTD
jgi:hypothetical protein